MEQTKLNKDEKRVLRLVEQGGGYSPALCPECVYFGCVRSLERKGLVKGSYVEGGGVEAVRLTDEGRLLLASNPKLSNPIDWKWTITTIIAVIGALAAIAALFVACSKYSPALCRPECVYFGWVRSLERKGLVKGAYVEGGEVADAHLTNEGRMLLADNPKLTNPIDWRWVITTIIAVIGALAAIAALFVACSK